MKIKTLSFAASIAAALLVLGASPASAQQNTVRIGYINVNPHSSATDATGPFLPGPPSGVSLNVKSQDTLFLSYARAINDRVEVELALGYPPTHEVTAKLNPAIVPSNVVNAFQGQVVAKIRQVAPTLFVNYKFGDPAGAWRPFVGVGVNYTKFDKRTSTAMGNGLNGGPTAIDLEDSFGLAAQAGVSYKMNERWTWNVSVATAQVKTKLTTNTAGAQRNIDIRFRPVALTLSAGYSF